MASSAVRASRVSLLSQTTAPGRDKPCTHPRAITPTAPRRTRRRGEDEQDERNLFDRVKDMFG